MTQAATARPTSRTLYLPTRRGVFLMLCGLPFSVLLLALDSALWPGALLWGIGCLALFALDVLLNLKAIPIAIDMPRVLRLGESDRVRLTFSHITRRVLIDIGVFFDHHFQPTPQTSLTILGPVHDHMVTLVPLQRGIGTLNVIATRHAGPLGLFFRQDTLHIDQTATILPNIHHALTPPLEIRSALLGLRPQSQSGEGGTFDSLKDFDSGTDKRRIDWKRSARHSALLAKNYDTERNYPIIFAFDCGQRMAATTPRDTGTPLSRLDSAINAALMMGRACLNAGDKIGLFSFDSQARHTLRPIGGARALPLFLEKTAQLIQRSEESNYTLAIAALKGMAERRSLIVVFTEFADTTTAEIMIDHLGRLARHHVLIFVCFKERPDPDVQNRPQTLHHVAQALMVADRQKERRVVLDRLRRAGLYVVEADDTTLSQQLIAHYIKIKSRSLV